MAVTDPVRVTHDYLRRRQTLIVGWLLLALAVFVAGVFGLESRDVASFRLSFPGDAFVLPNLVVPSAPYAYVVAALLALFGARQFMRGGARWSSWLLGRPLFHRTASRMGD
jgi:simple sugar transport system permease protein